MVDIEPGQLSILDRIFGMRIPLTPAEYKKLQPGDPLLLAEGMKVGSYDYRYAADVDLKDKDDLDRPFVRVKRVRAQGKDAHARVHEGRVVPTSEDSLFKPIK